MFFLYQNLFFGAGAGRSRAFMSGARSRYFYLVPEPKKKKSGAGADGKWLGSATLADSYWDIFRYTVGKSVKIRRFKEHLHHGSRIWMINMKTMKQGSLWLNSYFCVLPIQKNWNFFCFMVLFLRGKLEFAWGKNLPLV